MFGIEIMFVSIIEKLRPTCRIEFVSTAVTVTEKSSCPALEMVQAQCLPLGRVLEFHGEFRILMLDRVFARITAVHADKPIEHQL
jgi:hypothetical protein